MVVENPSEENQRQWRRHVFYPQLRDHPGPVPEPLRPVKRKLDNDDRPIDEMFDELEQLVAEGDG